MAAKVASGLAAWTGGGRVPAGPPGRRGWSQGHPPCARSVFPGGGLGPGDRTQAIVPLRAADPLLLMRTAG